MPVKIGLSAMFLGDVGIDDVLEIAARPGIEVLDAWYDMPCHVLEEGEAARRRIEDAITSAKDRTGLVAVAHLASFDVNPIAYNPAMQRACLEELFRSLRFASRIGARAVTLHGGENAFAGTFTRFDIMLLERLLTSLVDFIEKEGMNITICIENDAPTARMSRPLESTDIIGTLLERHPSLGFTLDIAHAAKVSRDGAGLPVRGNRLGLGAVDGLLDQFGPRTRIVHVSWPGIHHTHQRIDKDDPAFMAAIASLHDHELHPEVVGIMEYEVSQFHGREQAIDAMIDDARWVHERLGGVRG